MGHGALAFLAGQRGRNKPSEPWGCYEFLGAEGVKSQAIVL